MQQLYNKITDEGVIGTFYNTLYEPQNLWARDVGMYFESTQAIETYGWLGSTPAMREMIGGRIAKALREDSVTIANKEFESFLEVSRQDLDRDKSGQILIRIEEMATRVNHHWNKLVTDLIVAGESTTCYDGQYFFDTDHVEGDSGTQSNDLAVDISALPIDSDLAGSTTKPSAEELNHAVLECVQAIHGFKDDQGEPMNEDAMSFAVMVPTPYAAAARKALSSAKLSNGMDNSLVGGDLSIRLIVNPRLTWTTKLAVFRTDGRVKPFILQDEIPVEMDVIGYGSEESARNKRHFYGAYTRRNVGYGYWQHACLATLT